MALFKELKELKEKLKYYEDMVPVNNMGKWSRSVAIESYTKKIFKLEQQIKLNKTNIFIDKPNTYNPKKDAIKLTGSAIAGTITALRLPKNK